MTSLSHSSNVPHLRDVLGLSERGEFRVNPVNGRVQQMGLLFWRNLPIRINPKNRSIETKVWFTWRNTGRFVLDDPATIGQIPCKQSVGRSAEFADDEHSWSDDYPRERHRRICHDDYIGRDRGDY